MSKQQILQLAETGTWVSTSKYAWDSTRSGFTAFETEIKFSVPFPQTPTVTVALTQLDCSKDHNLRVQAVADKITPKGFLLQIKWWSDTHIYSAAATWIALGFDSATGTVGAQATGDLEDGNYYIKHYATDKSLDVFEGRHDNSTPIITYEFHGKDNQLFTLKKESDGSYTITAKHSGKVLDISGGSTEDMAQVIQYTPHGGDNQRFTFTPNEDGTYTIVCKKSKKVLDVIGSGLRTKVLQNTPNSGPSQRWLITKK